MINEKKNNDKKKRKIEMNSVEVMVKEHELISRMLKVMRKACFGILKGETPCYEDLYAMADFVKYYADGHHHDKEEKFLFKVMERDLGPLGQKLIRNGMLVEHDLGRLYMSELREALKRVQEGDEESKLDVIANMISYTHLLDRHISKENTVVYPFGEKQLTKEVQEEVDAQTAVYEAKAEEKGTQKHYEDLVTQFEKKYIG